MPLEPNSQLLSEQKEWVLVPAKLDFEKTTEAAKNPFQKLKNKT